ncbi:MAG: YabP/YqfC family sporulation protein [Lachnospiraceae bacterium]|nr:YabP/YqfC family sporulation protein [Lachnospiraceae bacterium]
MRKFIDALELPKDLCLGALNVKLTGQYEAYIENYRSIIEYGDSIIKLQGKNSRLSISGKNLKIVCFTKDDMKIKGYLQEVKFY